MFRLAAALRVPGAPAHNAAALMSRIPSPFRMRAKQPSTVLDRNGRRVRKRILLPKDTPQGGIRFRIGGGFLMVSRRILAIFCDTLSKGSGFSLISAIRDDAPEIRIRPRILPQPF